jgi:hypothetical protein
VEGDLVLADHEGTATPGDPEEEAGRAEVAVGDPDLARPDGLQDLVQQRPLPGVAVLAREHVGDQHRLRVEHDQGVAGQRPGSDGAQLLEAVLGPGQVVAVEDLDRVTRQPGGPPSAHGRDDRSECPCGVPDQFRRDARLGAVDLVVDGPERDADGLGVGLEGGVDGGPDIADDRRHEVHDGGEEQGAGVLPVGGPLEEGVDGPGVQGVFQGGPGHDGDGALLCEPVENGVQDHGAASVEFHYLPVWRHFSRRISPTSKPCFQSSSEGLEP